MIDLRSATELLRLWLSQQVTREGFIWLEQKRQQVAEAASLPQADDRKDQACAERIAGSRSERVFYTAFSAVPRYTGKQDLVLTEEDLQAATAVRPGWYPGHWSLDQAARTLLVLTLPQTPETYWRSLERLFTTADVGELVALYQSLPLLPDPERYTAQAAEGVRSNMTLVFNAVALRNPYPADYFNELAWNQMVLKAVFVGSPLYLIQGLDRRANRELARMLTDYAHERWAAKRSVTPELWRAVGPFVSPQITAALEKVLADPEPTQQEAAALACAQSPLPEAQALLERQPALHSAIRSGQLTWDSFNHHRLQLNHDDH